MPAIFTSGCSLESFVSAEPVARPATFCEPSPRPLFTRAVLLTSDVAAHLCAFWLGTFLWHLVDNRLRMEDYAQAWPVTLLFFVAYGGMGMYKCEELNPVQELRRASAAICVIYSILAVALFLSKETSHYSRANFLLTWAQALIYVPLFRNLSRARFSSRPWWGASAVILGTGPLAEKVIGALRDHPEFGLKPIAILENDHTEGDVLGVPIVANVALARVFANAGVRHAIIALPGVSREELMRVFNANAELFPNVIIVPDILGVSSLWVEPADLGGVISLKVRQRLLMPSARLVKFIMDRAIAFCALVALLPAMIGVYFIVRIFSSRSPLYSQRRKGLGGRDFALWKFRSMVDDADAVLQNYLDSDPALRQEWETSRKLKDDPRITTIGRVLRRTSLDELPQLWNVLKGDMSLVGPRPIVADEVGKYGDYYRLYGRVTPGVTGLWQVSGRSEAGYEKRIRLDAYYVRNWSVWLDLYILAQTIKAVVARSGAC